MKTAASKAGAEWARKSIGDDFTVQEAFEVWYSPRFGADKDSQLAAFAQGWQSVKSEEAA